MKAIKKWLKKILPDDFILWTHKIRAVAANFVYGFPSRKLKVIGITGTNGKTTVCNLIAKVIEESGRKVGMATTINFKVGEKEWKNNTKMTSLDPFELQKILRQMVDAGCEYAVIETTSHAISQSRNWGIKYDVVALTNITHDHLDYHKSFSDYRETKMKLFKDNPNISIVNRDDPSYVFFAKLNPKKLYFYGIDEKADVTAKKMFMSSKGTLFTLITPESQIVIDLKLPGKYNVYNALLASTIAISIGIPLETVKRALEKVKGIPGRMEVIETNKNYMVIVDFAHTPDGLKNVFETIRSFAKGRIIHVGGATGRRDKTKRPLLGALSGKYADISIVTNEDPYDEDPWAIIEEVSAGILRGGSADNPKVLDKNFFKVPDRTDAIKLALSKAQDNDIVLITGKGAEEVMAVGDKLVPYSDKKVVESILENSNDKIQTSI
jgi:UDP-N-acetylmuramoyl-L-alanyl-D-glutamate--2,6-diaminopimelate ligase